MSLFPTMSPHVLAPGAVAFAGTASSTSNISTYTFSGVAIGTASSDRKVVVFTSSDGYTTSDTLTSITVGGATASLVASGENFATNSSYIYQIDVSSGTTADIIVTWSGTQGVCSVITWAVTGCGASAHDTGKDSQSSPDADTIDIPADGVCVGGAHSNTSGSFTWVGLTERVDEPAPDGDWKHSGASDAFATVTSGRTISSQPSAGSQHGMVCASWGPG